MIHCKSQGKKKPGGLLKMKEEIEALRAAQKKREEEELERQRKAEEEEKLRLEKLRLEKERKEKKKQKEKVILLLTVLYYVNNGVCRKEKKGYVKKERYCQNLKKKKEQSKLYKWLH